MTLNWGHCPDVLAFKFERGPVNQSENFELKPSMIRILNHRRSAYFSSDVNNASCSQYSYQLTKALGLVSRGKP